MQNHFNDGKKRETLKIGKWLPKLVDSEAHFREKLKNVQVQWAELKSRQLKENAGISFVSFRDKSCVSEMIDELEIFKAKLEGSGKYEKLDIESWEV
jgi:hypothetical protein